MPYLCRTLHACSFLHNDTENLLRRSTSKPPTRSRHSTWVGGGPTSTSTKRQVLAVKATDQTARQHSPRALTVRNDDNKPVIPKIPGPRKPSHATAPLPPAAVDAIARLDRALRPAVAA